MPTFEQIQDEINNMLEISDDELDEEQKALMDEYLNELAAQEAGKVDSFAQYIKLQAARMEALKDESKRLSQRAKSAENGIERLKRRYLGIMAANGLKKVSGNVYQLSERRSESVKAPDTQEQLEALFELYPDLVNRKVEFSANKTEIKKALKEHPDQSIPGCYIKENFSLQIR